MKLLWRGSWLDVPGYAVPGQGVLLRVDAAVPLWRITRASARPTRQAPRKVAVFLLTDGFRSTWRKAQTKRREPRFSGDYNTVLFLGQALPAERRVIALGLRVPPAAQQVVVHHALVREVAPDVSRQQLLLVASTLLANQDEIAALARQSYLYSAMELPCELVEKWHEALGRAKVPDGALTGRNDEPTVRPSNDRLVGERVALPFRRQSPARHVIRPPKGTSRAADTFVRFDRPRHGQDLPVALLGGGDHARTEIIPALRSAGLDLCVVADREPQIAALAGRCHGFRAATTDPDRAIGELPRPGLVVVATAHDSHADLACRAAEAGHRVFVEKPPTVTAADVARLAKVMTAHLGMVEIGYNRRYHPLVRRLGLRLGEEQGPLSITCTVKELGFHPDHWYFWPNQGTRFTGNLCHWIDLAVSLLDGQPLPVSVALSPRPPSCSLNDEERVLTVTFEDGSVLSIFATTRGDDIRGVQEQIEVRRGHTTVTIDDLWKLRVRRGGIERRYRTTFRTKAHTRMYGEAFRRVVAGEPATYPVRDMVVVSAIQITANDLALTGEPVSELPPWLCTHSTGARPRRWC